MTKAQVEFPEKLGALFEPHRYKIYHGGRGGAKSWGFARALITIAASKTTRILCAREIQRSISDSVHKLLVDQIHAMGLMSKFAITNNTIRATETGSEFLFAGLRHNIASLKSYEGVDIVWVEEAQTVSRASWDILVPTIRKDGSEIWISFNPDLEDDETYQRFVVTPPTGAKVVKISYHDNPWFPAVLEQERLDLLERDPAAYKNVWEGECKQAVDGAIFAEEVRLAAENNRLTLVEPEAGRQVHTFWDLGRSDNTAIWFAQIVGMEFRIIDYYQCNGRHMSHFISVLAERQKEAAYQYGDHWLPHDAEHKQLAAERTIKQQLQDALLDNPKLGQGVMIVPNMRVTEGIDAARTIFSKCFFDKNKCADGIQCLRRYRYERDEETGKIGKHPVHDMYSHGADAFRYLAIALRKEEAQPATMYSDAGYYD